MWKSILALLVVMAVISIYTLQTPSRKSEELSLTSVVERFGAVDSVYIAVVVDNHRDPEGRCLSAWGLSIYVETEGVRILFDTGPDPQILLHNVEVLGIDLSKLTAVVISHEHGDHVGGLEAIAEINSSIPIYIPAGMSLYTKRWILDLGFSKVVEVVNTTVIAPGVAIVGQLYGPPYEQALAINLANRGLVVVVGCSHPGIVNIVEKASRELGAKPYAVIGGLHLPSSLSVVRKVMSELKRLGVEVVIPIHCSGDVAAELASKLFGFNMSREGHVCSSILFRGG